MAVLWTEVRDTSYVFNWNTTFAISMQYMYNPKYYFTSSSCLVDISFEEFTEYQIRSLVELLIRLCASSFFEIFLIAANHVYITATTVYRIYDLECIYQFSNPVLNIRSLRHQVSWNKLFVPISRCLCTLR